MKKGLLIALAVVVFLGVLLANSYNRLVSADEGVKSAWAQVENVYQRRLDLIPNLVETVKGYASHESETLMAVTEARASVSKVNVTSDVVNNPEMLQKFQASQSGLSSALSRLLVVSENYPELKANHAATLPASTAAATLPASTTATAPPRTGRGWRCASWASTA